MRRNYEFALVVVLVSVLVLVLMQKLNSTRDDMEEAGMQMEAAAIRAQLLEKVVHREAFGGGLPPSDNPVDWLPAPPRDYLGELVRAPERTSVWYFDRRENVLVYRFRDGHAARFRLSRQAGQTDSRGVLAGVGLQRLNDVAQ
jgi:hypothetical protein